MEKWKTRMLYTGEDKVFQGRPEPIFLKKGQVRDLKVMLNDFGVYHVRILLGSSDDPRISYFDKESFEQAWSNDLESEQD